MAWCECRPDVNHFRADVSGECEDPGANLRREILKGGEGCRRR